jgi:hypothetical protein
MEKTRQMMQDKPVIISVQQLGCFVREVISETGSRKEACRVVVTFMGKMYFFSEIQHRLLNLCDVGVS